MNHFSLMSLELILNQVERLRLILLIIFLLLFIINPILGQEDSGYRCEGCASFNKTYLDDPNNNPILVQNGTNANNNGWDDRTRTNENSIVRFNKPKNYRWAPANTTTIRGITLEGGANLELDRASEGDNPVFDILGQNTGCIIIKSGSTLTIRYISRMEGLKICVESGGKIVFDARDPDRNSFTFKDVEINLQDDNSKIEFGEANIINGGGVVINGYTGESCDDPNANIVSTGNSTGFCDFVGLPVEWLYVKSKYNSTERSSTIDWATAKEWENSHFEIERSINGISNWEKIGEVQGMGWTDEVTEYSFCDEKLPIGGGNIYYRLKQVDFNLQFEYSKTVTVRVPPLTVTKGKWRVYPNPVNDVNFYIARTELEEISSISVKVLSTQDQMRSIKVVNERELTEAVKRGFDKLPKGVFIIEIQWNQKVEYLKVIKN